MATNSLAYFKNRFLKILISSQIFILILFQANAVAQDDVLDDLALLYGDEETVSVATGSSKAVRLAPSIASVVTAEDIKILGATSLEDVLETIPGVHVSLRSLYASNYSMRGVSTTYSPQILLLLNGYPYTEVYSGSKISVQKIPIKNVKRVEVIRGPGSAIYGADAFAGVINIITYGNEDIESTTIGASVGSFDTTGAWLQTKTSLADWQLGLSLEWEKSDGDDDRKIESDLQSTLDTIFATSASNAPGAADTHYKYVNSQIQLSRPQWKATLNTYYQDDTGLGTGIADALNPEGNQYFLKHLFELGYKSDNDPSSNWTTEARINYLYLKQQSTYTIFPAGSVLPIGSDGNVSFAAPSGFVLFTDGLVGIPGGRDRYYSGEYSAIYHGFSKHRIRLAAGYKKQYVSIFSKVNFGPGVIDGTQPVVDGTLTDITGTENIFLPDLDRRSYYFSAQNEWSFYKDWELTAGLRYDDYSDFGDTLNPRVAVVWQTNYNLTTKLLYGHAFRAPSFSELYARNNPALLGNPTLEPEKVKTIELSFNYRFSYDLNTQLNLFSYDTEDLINFLPDNNALGSVTAQNTKGQKGSGFEIELSWQATSNIAIAANYSWQNSEDKVSSEDVAEAPQQLLYAELRWKILSNLSLSSQLHHVADRPRAPTDPRPELNDYTLLNMKLLADDFFEGWEFGLSAHNLLNEEAYEPGDPTVPIDHPLAGRSITLDVLYRFGN